MPRTAHNFQDLTGMRFGKLEVLRLADARPDKRTRWVCKCDCGNIIEVRAYSLKSGVSDCGCGKIEDLTGRRFGMLTVLSLDTKRTKSRETKWICRCDCGEIRSVTRSALVNGITKSCGCRSKSDITGKRFGRLFVLRREPGSKWLCHCDCGNDVIVSGCNLKSGNTSSCGCYAKEHTKKVVSTHGLSSSPLFSVWTDMKGRCQNSHRKCFQYYGARGIKVCDEWSTFKPFYEWAMKNGYKPGLSIDRIDVNGDYCPDNCRWATKELQANNTRSNLYLTIDGETHTAAQWSRKYGVCASTISYRYKKGWTDRECVFGKQNN